VPLLFCALWRRVVAAQSAEPQSGPQLCPGCAPPARARPSLPTYRRRPHENALDRVKSASSAVVPAYRIGLQNAPARGAPSVDRRKNRKMTCHSCVLSQAQGQAENTRGNGARKACENGDSRLLQRREIAMPSSSIGVISFRIGRHVGSVDTDPRFAVGQAWCVRVSIACRRVLWLEALQVRLIDGRLVARVPLPGRVFIDTVRKVSRI